MRAICFNLIALLLISVTGSSAEQAPVAFPDAGFLRLDTVIHADRDITGQGPRYAEIEGETRHVFESPDVVGQLTVPVDEAGAITIEADQIPPLPDGAIGLRVQYHYTPESVFLDNKRRAYHYLPRDHRAMLPLKIMPFGIPTPTAEVQFQVVFPVAQTYTTLPLLLPPNAHLEFSCGLHQAWRVDNDSGANFIVALGEGDAWEVLHEAVIEDSDMFESTTWQEQSIDLSAHAGKPIRLRFSTQGLPHCPDPQFSFPLWGNVLLYTKTPAPQVTKPNFLLISLDTLRADRLGAYGYHRNTSPNLDRFAAESVVFEQAIVPAPWTTPCHASVFTGYHPRVHQAGVVSAGYHLGAEWKTLAEHFREAGHLTAAFTEGVAIRGQMGFAQGFDRYSDGPESGRHYHGKSPQTFAAAGDWLEQHRGQPFFLFVHTYEIHAPYGAPEPWGRLYAEPDYEFSARLELADAQNDRDRLHVSNLYDAGIAYADAQLGRFLQRLRDMDVFDDTVIVIFSDHGEEFWEHGVNGHTTHLYDEVLHVPLIVRLPEKQAPVFRVPEQVGLIDLFATVLELAGMTSPVDGDSVSLMPLLRQEPGYTRELVHAEFIYDGSAETGLPIAQQAQVREAVRSNARKYLRYSEAAAPPDEGAIEERLYNLETDPAEQHDLRDTAAEEAASFSNALQQFRAEKEAVRLRHRSSQPAVRTMSPEDLEALRGLGYF